MQGEATPVSPRLTPAPDLFKIGVDLFGEVQRSIGTGRVRALRIKLGNRTLKEFPVAPLTAVTTVLLVALAVVVSSVSVEVEKEPASNQLPASEARP